MYHAVSFLGSLHKQLCWYLTCERKDEFDGLPNNQNYSLTSNLVNYAILALLVATLGTFLLLVYCFMWLCFWQMEDGGPSASTRLRNSTLASSHATSKPRPTQLFTNNDAIFTNKRLTS